MANKTIVEHAAYELTKAGLVNNEDPEARQVATNTIALVRRIEKMKMSDKQAAYVLEAFSILTQFLPLTPLTDDPEEWDKFEIDRTNVDTKEVEKKTIWQSRRATSVFSEDEGKTWTDQRTGKTGTSIDHVKQAEEEAKEKADREKAKAEAAERAKAPKPTAVLNDTPAGEESATPVAPTHVGIDPAQPGADKSVETTVDTSKEETK